MERAKQIEMLRNHGIEASVSWSNKKIQNEVSKVHQRVASERLIESWITRKRNYGNPGLKSTAFRSDVVRRAWISRKRNVSLN